MPDEKQRPRKALVKIIDFDIATIEALHDLLLNNGYDLNFVTLVNARKLTNKMYKAFETTKTKGIYA